MLTLSRDARTNTYTETDLLESNKMTRRRTPEYIAFRLEYIRRRRASNKRARAKGFRNYAEMSAYVE